MPRSRRRGAAIVSETESGVKVLRMGSCFLVVSPGSFSGTASVGRPSAAGMQQAATTRRRSIERATAWRQEFLCTPSSLVGKGQYCSAHYMLRPLHPFPPARGKAGWGGPRQARAYAPHPHPHPEAFTCHRRGREPMACGTSRRGKHRAEQYCIFPRKGHRGQVKPAARNGRGSSPSPQRGGRSGWGEIRGPSRATRGEAREARRTGAEARRKPRSYVGISVKRVRMPAS